MHPFQNHVGQAAIRAATVASAFLVAVLLASCGDDAPPAGQAPPGRQAGEQTPKGKEPQDDGRTLADSVGMKLVLIQPGTFVMGSDAGNGHPPHKVTISTPFHLGVHEVTRTQYKKVVGAEKARFEDSDRPANNVSFHDAKYFCSLLSEREGLTYRLPTEAEWEYACRAGTVTAYSFGDDASALGDHAWFYDNSGETLPIKVSTNPDGTPATYVRRMTREVGQKLPNPWGLYDMHGNVWEWCEDLHGPYDADHITDPTGPTQGKFRVLRGGSWHSTTDRCRSAHRGRARSSSIQDSHGFRVVREVAPPRSPNGARGG